MLKILFHDITNKTHMTENELTSLINLAYMLSNSIEWYQKWIDYEDRHSFYKTIIMSLILGVLGKLMLL